MNNKKSQAALEFLTTYAWAFLVILIMVGALAYFGILNPSKLLPDRCNFGSELECVDYKLDATAGNIKLKLKNDVGEPITISSIVVTSNDVPAATFSCGGTGITTVVASGTSPEYIIGTDGVGTIDACATAEWTAAGFTVGQKGKVQITVTYNTVKSGPTYPHKVGGEVFATVQ